MYFHAISVRISFFAKITGELEAFLLNGIKDENPIYNRRAQYTAMKYCIFGCGLRAKWWIFGLFTRVF
jgi:hypothetical protein